MPSGRYAVIDMSSDLGYGSYPGTRLDMVAATSRVLHLRRAQASAGSGQFLLIEGTIGAERERPGGGWLQ